MQRNDWDIEVNTYELSEARENAGGKVLATFSFRHPIGREDGASFLD